MAVAVCSVDSCHRPVRANGMCRTHYDLVRRRGTTVPAYRSYGRQGCAEDGCEEPHSARGYCHLHYSRRYRNNEFQP